MKIAQAEGARALGLAEAEVEKAKRDAMYEGEAGMRRAKVEIAAHFADKLRGMLAGVKVIPKDAFVALMQEGQAVPITLTDESIKKSVPAAVPNK